MKQRARGRLGRALVRQRGEGSGAPRPRRCGSAGKARARSGGRLGVAAPLDQIGLVEKRGNGMAETERKRREKGVVYKGRPLVPGDG